MAWWGLTRDLRPYLLLQLAPLIAIPAVLHAQRAPLQERVAFGSAVACYVVAKCLEMADRVVFAALGVSGHTLKHVLAAAGAAWVAYHFARLAKESC